MDANDVDDIAHFTGTPTGENLLVQDLPSQENKQNNFINLTAFFMFGFTEYVTFGALLTGSQDILANTSIPTNVTIVFANVPYVVLSITCPYFISKVPVLGRVCGAFICFSGGILLVALSPELFVKLLGLGLNSVGYFFVDVGLLPLTAFYGDEALLAFSGGTGFALVGALYYTVLTTYGCATPQTTLLTTAWLPLTYPVFYYLMKANNDLESSRKKAQRREVQSDGKFSKPRDLEITNELVPSCDTPEPPLTGTDKLKIAKSLLPYASAFFLGITGEYLSLGGLATTLAFPRSNAVIELEPRDHFVVYSSGFAVGEFFGRSYGFISMCVRCHFNPVTEHIWIFSLIIWFDVFFLFFASWYRFLHSAWIVVFIVFTVGLAAGALFCNAFSLSGKSEEPALWREFSRAFLVGVFASGLVIGSLLGAVVEPLVRDHCMEITEGLYCITRETKTRNSTKC